MSIRKIAGLPGYSPAAISKEIRRNSNKNGIYNARAALWRADWRATKDKNANKRTPFLLAHVQEKLRANWSPEQISGHLKWEFGEEPERIFLSRVFTAGSPKIPEQVRSKGLS